MNTSQKYRISIECGLRMFAVSLLTIIFIARVSATPPPTLQEQVDAALAAHQTSVKLIGGVNGTEYVIPSGPAISLTGVSNFTIDAGGVDIVMGDKANTANFTNAISLLHCGNVSIVHGTIDYSPLPFVQGTIDALQKTSDNALDCALITFDSETPPPSSMTTATSPLGIGRGITTDTSTTLVDLIQLKGNIKKGSGTSYVDSVQIYSGNQYTVRFNQCIKLRDTTAVGDKISFPVRSPANLVPTGEQPGAVLLQQCGGCTIQDMTIYSAPLIAIHDLSAGTDSTLSAAGNNYLGNSIIPKNIGSIHRLRSANAGGIVCRKGAGPIIINNTIKGVGDDAIAIHTYLAQVVSDVTNSKTCTVRTRLPLSNDSYVNGGNFQAHDMVKIFQPNSSNAFGTQSPALTTAEICDLSSWTVQGSANTMSGCTVTPGTQWQYTLTFTEPVTLAAGTWLQDTATSAYGFVVQENTISNGPARGIFARGDGGSILSNTISFTAKAAILVMAEVDTSRVYSGEGNLTDDMWISGNDISFAVWGWSNKTDPGAGAISMLAADPTWGPWSHTNATIQSNTLDYCVGVQILLESVQTCLVASNTFNHPGLFNVSPSFGSALAGSFLNYSAVDGTSTTCNALIWISNVDNITFKNTNICNASNGANGLPLYTFPGIYGTYQTGAQAPTNPFGPTTNLYQLNGVANAFKWH